MSLPSADQFIASAVQYLIQGDEQDAALLLLFCDAALAEDVNDYYHRYDVAVHLTGPRLVYDALERDGWLDSADGKIEHGQRLVVRRAFEAITPHDWSFTDFTMRVQLVDDLDPNWRAELTEIAHGRGVHNQGVEIPGRSTITWKGNIKFRADVERRIAIALDATGVLFLPNCLVRLSAGETRVTKESDFLVCHDGKWGILEVDGPFHPRAALDHSRDRLFQAYRIRVIQRFDWEECRSDPTSVVQRFLTLLDKNG